MEIGILVPATSDTKNIADIAQRVENLGFESLWIPEHPVIPVGFKTEVPGGGTLAPALQPLGRPVCGPDYGCGGDLAPQAGDRHLSVSGA